MTEPSSTLPKNADLLGGRLRLLPPGELSGARRALYDHLSQTQVPWANRSGFQAELPDGRLIGPFNPSLYAPETAQAFFAWGTAFSQHTPLSDDVQQIVILTVGAAWNAGYELYAHLAVGRTVGLPENAMQAILAGQEPGGVSQTARAAYRFTDALVRDHQVNDARYQEAVSALGEAGVASMVQLIGQYLTTSALLNAFRVPVPEPG